MTISANQYLQRPILPGQVNFPISLAPMVGMSHVALRLLVRHYLPAGAETFWPTEMLSSWRLPREEMGATAETLKGDGETHLVPQILGNEEFPIRDSVKKLVDWGAVGIDINMGCPVNKALRHNYGVALMGDADYAAEVVRMTVRHAGVPVSVKLRAGLQNDVEFLLKFTLGLQAAGASWITLHPRVGNQKRRGAADWSQIRTVREGLKIPVIGNGDVQTADDALEMMAATGCDAVMVGRALAARPWLLWQVGERLGFSAPAAFQGQTAPQTAEEEGAEYGRASLHFVDSLEAHFNFEDGFKRLKFHQRMTCVWLEFGHALQTSCSRAKSYADLRATLHSFFANPQRMFSKTHLRE